MTKACNDVARLGGISHEDLRSNVVNWTQLFIMNLRVRAWIMKTARRPEQPLTTARRYSLLKRTVIKDTTLRSRAEHPFSKISIFAICKHR